MTQRTKNPDKGVLRITVSGIRVSSHYVVSTAARHCLIAFFLLVAGSFFYNYLQHQHLETAYNRINQLNRANITLKEDAVFNSQQVKMIHDELAEIERIAELDELSTHPDLSKRMRTLRQYYHSKEDEYSQVNARLVQIEEMIKPVEEKEKLADEEVGAWADSIALTVQQQTVLLNSIPSGFPTESRVITSHYGGRVHPVTNIEGIHTGTDIRAKHKPVYATAAGVVRSASYSRLNGNRIIVQHNFGFTSHYAHLSEMRVKYGDIVQKGALLGISGNTGRSTGPHLHYEVRYLGRPFNPIHFLNWEFGSQEIFKQVKGVKWLSLINVVDKQITYPISQLSQQESVVTEK